MGHGHCQECGRRVRGQHPLLISKAFEVGTVHFGPRLLAFAAFQKMICGVSYDKIRLGFEQMLGFPVARSTLCRAMQRLARRAKPTRDALVEALRASPVVYADETGWKQGGRRVWLWVFTNLRETVYEILPGRGFEQAASVLGKNYAGTLGVDGWAPYRCFKEATLQTCYNHLLHRCHELLETATRGAVRFPRLVKAILRHALALRDRRDAGEISPHGLRVAKGLLQAKMNRLLHGRFTNPANQRFAKHLRRYRDNLFVFLDRADVEATNYPAEQDIRIAVVNRKTCGGGNRTAKGAQAQSILMSLILKWTPFFRPGVKVVKQACSIKKEQRKVKKNRTKHSPVSKAKVCIGGTTRAGDSGGTIPPAQGSREPDPQMEAASFWRTSRVLSRPKRWAEAMPRCARPNCFRKSGS